jgi:hypothetical protein
VYLSSSTGELALLFVVDECVDEDECLGIDEPLVEETGVDRPNRDRYD